MKSVSIIPLFSKVVCCHSLENNYDFEYDKIKKKYSIKKCSENLNDNDTSRSDTLYVLNDFPNLKKEISNKFFHFKNDILKYENTEFKMTTSWITKSEKYQKSEVHNHKNSFYSGVLYIDEEIEDSNEKGKLEFSDLNTNSFSLNNPSEYNIYNSTSWSITPEKNLLVFFPSEVFHRITLHKSNHPRYSIAFNFFPIGSIGNLDSSIKILN